MGRIKTPVLILWGEHDRYATLELAEESARLCDGASLERLDTTHWAQHDAPQQVNQRMVEFLRG